MMHMHTKFYSLIIHIFDSAENPQRFSCVQDSRIYRMRGSGSSL